MATDGVVMTTDRTPVPLRVDTICLHGDTPGAAELARQIRGGLIAAGVHVAPIGTAR
jgi:UPF0271 protein